MMAFPLSTSKGKGRQEPHKLYYQSWYNNERQRWYLKVEILLTFFSVFRVIFNSRGYGQRVYNEYFSSTENPKHVERYESNIKSLNSKLLLHFPLGLLHFHFLAVELRPEIFQLNVSSNKVYIPLYMYKSILNSAPVPLFHSLRHYHSRLEKVLFRFYSVDLFSRYALSFAGF